MEVVRDRFILVWTLSRSVDLARLGGFVSLAGNTLFALAGEKGSLTVAIGGSDRPYPTHRQPQAIGAALSPPH